MDLFEAVEKRYSYRGAFADRPVPRSDLKRIVAAGLKAPSGRNAQTTSFVIVDDPRLLEKIGAMHENNRAVQTARAMIACVIDREPEAVYEGFSFQIEDCAAAVENMLLAVAACGYATVWIDGWLRPEGRSERIGKLLGLPEDKTVRVMLPVGIPVKEGPRREKKPFHERAWFNRYGETAA
jgi:nitroreductase